MEDRFSSLMADASLSQYSDSILGLIRNSIRIGREPAAQSDLAIGQSKLGGLPDLPPGVEWPTWVAPGYPHRPSFLQRLLQMEPSLPQEPTLSFLSFVAQFNLSEIAPHDTAKVLPERGMLYFFFDTNPMVSFDDPPHKEGRRVIFWNGDSSLLTRTAAPEGLPTKRVYGVFRPTFASEMVLPSSDSMLLQRLGMSQSETDRYARVLRKLSSQSDRMLSRLLGHPDHIQATDMLTECQLASHGIATSDLPKLQGDSRVRDLLEGATDWQLLLQMDSQHLNTNWGDAGRIYYFTKSFDLAQQSLDEIQLALQCG